MARDRAARHKPRRTNVSSRGRAFLTFAAILLIIAFVSSNRIMLLAALMLASVMVIATIVVRVRRLKLGVQRTFRPATVELGESTRVTLLVSNLATRRSAAAFWHDTLPFAPGFTPDAVLAPLDGQRGRVTRAKSIVRLSYDITPPRRGLFEIGPLAIESGDPFGLIVGSVELPETHTLVVTPRVYELPGTGLLLDAGSGSSTVTRRSSNGSEDDLMTREYRRGDALRRVHWRASARHGELMVRQEEPRSRPETRIIVDTRIDGYDRSFPFDMGGDPQESESAVFEWVVSFIASLGEHLHNAGYVVTVLETAGQQITQPGAPRGVDDAADPFLLSLAAIRLVRDLDELHAEAAAVQRSEATLAPIIAVLSAPSDITLEWVLQQRRPYEVGTAIVINCTDELADRIDGAGWNIVRITDETAISDAWSIALAVMSRG